MESSNTRSKRRRLISVSSHVSLRPRPDVPATFESLNDDTITTTLQFVGGRSYRSFGGVNKQCKEVYLNTPGMTKETFLCGYAPLLVIQDRYDDNTSVEAREALSKGVLFYNRKDVLEWALQERKTHLLKEICFVAVEEERFDLLNKMWNNLEYEGDFREIIFEGMDEYAADCGKLNVLKWVENKVPYIDEVMCSYAAAEKGHLHENKKFLFMKDLVGVTVLLREQHEKEIEAILVDVLIREMCNLEKRFDQSSSLLPQPQQLVCYHSSCTYYVPHSL